MPKKKEQADVWRPDVYICNDCGHRFAEAEYIQKEEDGIVFQRTVCPKCKSEQIRLSSWSEKDFNK
ncbi:MAG: zinc ribbon domain-containing protein [Candidatus Heimdallarchaeota archaeon]